MDASANTVFERVHASLAFCMAASRKDHRGRSLGRPQANCPTPARSACCATTCSTFLQKRFLARKGWRSTFVPSLQTSWMQTCHSGAVFWTSGGARSRTLHLAECRDTQGWRLAESLDTKRWRGPALSWPPVDPFTWVRRQTGSSQRCGRPETRSALCRRSARGNVEGCSQNAWACISPTLGMCVRCVGR